MRNCLTRKVLLVALALFALSPMALAQTEGEWWIQKHDDGAQLSFRYSYSGGGENYNSNWSNTDDPAKLGIAGVLNREGQVNFDIARPAGTFKCEGWMRAGRGSGHFTFAPNAQFAAELEKRGLGRPDERQSMKLAMANVQVGYADALKQAGYSFGLDELVRAATHGVTEGYLKDMQAAGLKPDSLRELVRMHDHGVTAEYVREMYAAGYKGLSYGEITRMRDHGVDAGFVRELAAAGYKDLPAQQIVRMRDHGVDGEYVKQLAAAGLKDLGPEQIVRMRDHGVTPEYAKGLVAAGFGSLEPEEMVRMRDHGVSPEFAAAVKREAFPNISASELVRLRDHGLSIDFIRENAKASSVEELIQMRKRGERRRNMM